MQYLSTKVLYVELVSIMNFNGRKNISEFCPYELSSFDDTANDPERTKFTLPPY